MEPDGAPTDLQCQVLGPTGFAAGPAGRDKRFRTEMVQLMDLGHMLLNEPDLAVLERVIAYATALDLPTGPLEKARALASGSAQLVAADADRATYISQLDLSAFAPLKSEDDHVQVWSAPPLLAQHDWEAFRRGAVCTGSIDFIALDYFSIAHRSLDDLRAELGITPRSDKAVTAGSRGSFEPDGISDSQPVAGRVLAESEGWI